MLRMPSTDARPGTFRPIPAPTPFHGLTDPLQDPLARGQLADPLGGGAAGADGLRRSAS